MQDSRKNRQRLGSAFESGSDEILRTIRHYLKRFVRPWEVDDLSLEVFQETALLLLDPDGKWLALFDEAFSPLAWIKRHAYLQVLSVYRDRKRAWDRTGAFDPNARDETIDLDLGIDCKSAWDTVRELLGDEDFSLLHGIFVEGYRQVEVAKALGVPVGTINARVSRAKAKARKILGEVNPF